MLTLSPDQKKVLKQIVSWYKKDRKAMQFVTLGGYAGTGKTTLIAVLRKKFYLIQRDLKVGFVSYTGKAARVLRQKLKEQNVIYAKDTVGTIHSLIYSPIVNEQEEIVGWEPKKQIECNLIIIDEASMVDGTIWRHLLAYGIPIIVVGDHGQLPPIAGNYNLMQKPILILEEIHRQAKKNPIIHLSIDARETGIIKCANYSDTVVKYEKCHPETQERMNELLSNYNSETLILCGYNKTRIRLNSFIRSALGFNSLFPVSGDRVICLRNNHKDHIFNGMLGTIESIEHANNEWYRAHILMDGEEKTYQGLISTTQFNNPQALNYTHQRKEIMMGDLFDFGYALTVHKAQGSQAKRVILFEERFPKMTDDQWKRWLYTAVTRAEEELYVFSS